MSQPVESNYFRKLVNVTVTETAAEYRYGYLSFDVLHRLVLLHHQRKLSQHVLKIGRHQDLDEDNLRRIDHDLHAYSTIDHHLPHDTSNGHLCRNIYG